jgi:hypothetical protein
MVMTENGGFPAPSKCAVVLALAHGLALIASDDAATSQSREMGTAERNALSRAVTQTAQEKLTEDRTGDLAKFNEDDLKMARAHDSIARSLGRLSRLAVAVILD